MLGELLLSTKISTSANIRKCFGLYKYSKLADIWKICRLFHDAATSLVEVRVK